MHSNGVLAQQLSHPPSTGGQPARTVGGASQETARELVERVARVTGLTRDEVIDRLVRERRDMGGTVRRELEAAGIRPHVWSDELIEFYSKSTAMLFETIVWNHTPAKVAMRQWIVDYLRAIHPAGACVLTFGDGLGYDSAALAAAGNSLHYFEVGERSVAFARDLFDAQAVTVEVIETLEQIPARSFDAVVCLDVLEHVPDAGGVVQLLADALKPGGRLIVHAPFWYLSPAVGTHLRTNRRYSGDVARLYEPAGLRPIDGRLFWDPLILEKRGLTEPGAPVPRATRLRLRAGGLLLSVGRYWSAPHIAVAKWLMSATDNSWPELDELRSSAAVSAG